MTLKVSEIFYSVSGEGPYLGTPSIFLRLAGCDLSCPFCDSKYSWSEGKEMSVEEVAEEIMKYPAEHLIVTGGEPLLQQEELAQLFELLQGYSYYFREIETNGTIEPIEPLRFYIDEWNISPKLPSANGPGIVARYFRKCDNSFNFKFVLKTVADLREMEIFLKDNDICMTCNNFYLMPQAITNEEQVEALPILIEYAKYHTHFRVTPRLQILAYGNKRGV